MTLRAIVLLAALLHAGSAMAELFPTNEKAKALFKQGLAFEAEGKGNEALKSYREAALADPTASTPVSQIAHLFYVSSKNGPAKEAAASREQASAAAHAALKIDDRDPGAMEVLRLLSDDQPQKRHQPLEAAKNALNEAEPLFHDQKYDEARAKYELAVKLDPAYAEAILFVGDCYFMQKDLPRAEQWFRKTVEVDPLYSLAWRFLFDAQLHQEKLKDAEVSAIAAISAAPSERQSWIRLGHLMGKWGGKLTPFQMTPRASFAGTTLTIDPKLPEHERAVWLSYGIAMAGASTKMATASQFARDFDAWETTMKIAVELGKEDQIKDEGLRAMLRFHKGGQLKAAVFLLLYREAYRADFEAWKKAEPAGVKRFIDTFQTGI